MRRFTYIIIFLALVATVWYFATSKPSTGTPIGTLNTGGEAINFTYASDLTGQSLIIKSDKQEYIGNDSSAVRYSITNTATSTQEVTITFNFNQNTNTGIDRTDKWNGVDWETIDNQFEIKAGETLYFQTYIKYPSQTSGNFSIEAVGDNGDSGKLTAKYKSGAVAVSDDEYWIYIKPSGQEKGDVIDIVSAKRGGGMFTQSKTNIVIKVKGLTDDMKAKMMQSTASTTRKYRIDLDQLKSQLKITTDTATIPEAIPATQIKLIEKL